MKRVLLFLLPILLIVTMVFAAFAFFQARLEEERLMDDLMRKARSVAESISAAARYVFLNQDISLAKRIVEGFEERERLQGCVIYGAEGEVLAITPRIVSWKEKERPYLAAVLATKKARGSLENLHEYSVYSYILPVFYDDGRILGFIEVVYDTSYTFTQLTDIWRRMSVPLIVLLLLIVLITILLQHRIFILPVLQLTEWFRLFQRGDIDSIHPIKPAGELGKLASEVEQVALSLRVARRVVTDEAAARVQKDEIWTEVKLRDLVRAKLGENALFVVSNREPYMNVVDEETEKPRWVRPASGVVTAVDPILRACGGTWVAHGAGGADRKFVNSKNKLGVPPEDNRYILKRVWLTKQNEEGYYYGFSNEGLWPLCHVTHTRPVFRDADWREYVTVNQKFADAVIEELPVTTPFVFVQDYHFTLLPKMIKEKRPDAIIALFWHIPWPNPEVFSICPYQDEILEGMLACDLIGFHVQSHCNNFLDTANRLLESRIDMERSCVVRRGKETLIRPFPISIAPPAATVPAEDQKEIARLRREYELEGKIVVVSVERIDYTKGIVERILAIDRFLEKYPQYKGRFVFLQLAAPSRTHIKRYHDLIGEIDELVDKKNWKHAEGGWKPIIYLKKHFSIDEILPYYRIGDVCIVSSLHDGMNLVAKEYVSARSDNDGVLILSRFTGASRELTDAVLINPYSIFEFAEAIRTAIEMPPAERRRRMEAMRQNVRENNIYKWAGSIVTELTGIKKGA